MLATAAPTIGDGMERCMRTTSSTRPSALLRRSCWNDNKGLAQGARFRLNQRIAPFSEEGAQNDHTYKRMFLLVECCIACAVYMEEGDVA